MCGIIGINSNNSNIENHIITGLKNLEYRGYDSAGIAFIINGELQTIKVKGKINGLEHEINAKAIKSNLMIGHTRWSTHGLANQINAHPHQTQQVSIVHNGIIENYIQIKEELIGLGHEFKSETDSEVIPHLITYYLNQNNSPLESIQKTIKRLEGAFSIAAIFLSQPDIIIVARKGSPLVIGYKENQMSVASDAYALSFLTNKITYLEEGDVAVLQSNKVEIYNNEKIIERPITTINNEYGDVSKGNFPHYMIKEIFEQPNVLSNTINSYCNQEKLQFNFPDLDIDFKTITKITLVACGSSYYASMLAKYWLETFTDLPIEVDIASEFRYRESYLPQNGLAIFLSQSGETADTIAAMRHAKRKGQITLSIINVKASSLDRESDYSLQCFAGPEISVASTKGFTSQSIILLMLSIHIASKINKINVNELKHYLELVTEVPGRIAELLNNTASIEAIAKEISSSEHVIFIGRNYIYPIALEGALKLKELSYIHAEAIASGELKHGSIALVDKNVPIIVMAPKNKLFEKTCSNAQEVAARDGNLITISSVEGNSILKSISNHQINISSSDPLIEPIIYSISLQLLAYYTAIAKGTNVDQPRNLAKSVTVE